MTLITSGNAFYIKVYFVLLTLLPPGSWEEESPRQSEVATSKSKREKNKAAPQWTTQPLWAQGSWGILSSLPWGDWNEAKEEEQSLQEGHFSSEHLLDWGSEHGKLSCVHTWPLHVLTPQLQGVCGQWERWCSQVCARMYFLSAHARTPDIWEFVILFFVYVLIQSTILFFKDEIHFYL